MSRIMVVAGEASGDAHASEVAKALKQLQPEIELVGIGGSKMREAGVEIIFDAAEIAVVGLVEVIKHYPALKRAWNKAVDQLTHHRPDLLILVDYPGFNLRLAKVAKQMGIKVLYYISPQIWAWHQSRIHKIKATVDHMAVIFPFEVAFYSKADIPVSYVGSPLAESVIPIGKEQAWARICHSQNLTHQPYDSNRHPGNSSSHSQDSSCHSSDSRCHSGDFSRHSDDSSCHFHDSSCHSHDSSSHSRDSCCHSRDSCCDSDDSSCHSRDSSCHSDDSSCHSHDLCCHSREGGNPAPYPIIGLLPGSRKSELTRLMPILVKTAKALKQNYPNAEFFLPIASTLSKTDFEPYFDPAITIHIIENNSHAAIEACDVIICSSGTVTLEAAILSTPMVLIYKTAPLTYWLAKRLIKIKHIGLCNILAGKTIVPELIQHDANINNIVMHTKKLLDNSKAREQTLTDLAWVRTQLGEQKTGKQVAELALQLIAN